MMLTIDNLDGRGAVDYSAAIDRSQKVEIIRVLNAPSTAKGMLCLVGSGLAVPVRRARIVMTADAGTLLFTGYLTTEPIEIYAGVASEGHVYRLAFSAVSDEWLLDKQASGALSGTVLGGAGGAIVKGLLGRLDPSRFTTTNVLDGQSAGVLEPVPNASWSAHAGAVADSTYAAYRVLGGAINMAQAGSVTHALNDGDGSLQVAGLRTAAVRELANDVTVTGEIEPTVYWTEVFSGDGTTAIFNLSGQPDAPNAGHAVLIADTFNTGSINPQRWAATDPGSHLALGPYGLTMSGGNGVDGGTTLVANDAVELGGTVVAELTGVTMNPGSAGVLAGFYGGTIAQSNCFAGFSIRQSGGNSVVTAMVNGAEIGATTPLLSGHSYTLRIRLHCTELLRIRQAFYAMVDVAGTAQVQRFGGGVVDAPMSLVFELRDEGASSNTPVTVLYDGSVTSSFAAPRFCLVNSVQLIGSIGAVKVQRTGTAWIQSTDPTTGSVATRLTGKANEGVDCVVTSSVTGTVTFFPSRIPAPGEHVTVLYRGRSRSAARLADPASLATEAAGGGVGTARWLGHVARPPARSTEDCECAAQAVLAFATNRAAAVSGSYNTINPGDIWPGDVLALTANGSTANVIVRRVEIDEHGASPEALTYRIAFANDWAEGLGIKLTEAFAKDALLPETALQLASGQIPIHTLANLQGLTVTGFSGTGASSAINIDAGTAPPPGGGFEVRRRDGGWGTNLAASGSGDVVLRTPVRGFSIPRAGFEETFYVRMYDNSSPPLYSRQSSAIVNHVPLG
jgi:hypothetical protein